MAKNRRFESKYSREKKARDLALYNEFQKLTADPEASRTEVTRYLMEKYGLSSESSVWIIRKRVEQRLAAEKLAKEA